MIYLDIETLPDPRGFGPYVNTKPKKGETQTQANMRVYLDTALDPYVGVIAVIGYAINDEPAQTLMGDRLLERFADVAAGQSITFNGLEFDLRWLWLHAMKASLPGLARWARPPRFSTDRHLDLVREFAGRNGFISQAEVAKFLGIPGEQTISGGAVAQVWFTGGQERVAAKCRADVEQLREIHRRMEGR